jgi:hypothetical protein
VRRSVLPGRTGLSSDERPFGDDAESPRRILASEVKKSDDAELVFACEAPVGVEGGVNTALSCLTSPSREPMVYDRARVGESGGVELSVKVADFECVLCGTVSLYPSRASISVSRWMCGRSFFVVNIELEKSDSSLEGKSKRGRLSILYTDEPLC